MRASGSSENKSNSHTLWTTKQMFWKVFVISTNFSKGEGGEKVPNTSTLTLASTHLLIAVLDSYVISVV